MYKYHTEDLSKYSFLITGGAGFIGSNLVEYLLHYGAGKVVVLDNFSTGSKGNIEEFFSDKNFSLIEGDIRDYKTCEEACAGIDFVLHQAALGSVPRSVKDPITTNQVNIDGFLNIINAAKENKVKKFIYAASSSVYGDHPGLPKVEAEIGKPLSPYAVTKYVNELYADVFHKIYGLEVTGLRYFNIFGPKQSPEGQYAAVIPLFINNILEGKSPEVDGDGEQTRDFTFVENAVQANIKSLFCDSPNAKNGVFNIAVGERISLNGLLEILKEVSGKEFQIKYRDSRVGDVRNSLADIAKAQQHLGYDPKFKLREGLEKTFEWFKK
jgi:UDP-N-acetylglucosamine/UDP-N-acetylgalactosamine 4-epimerase